ncbi:MAG: methionine adenosyltransferase [Planctomycetota bacterium]|jgi:S-adenosylmethionine synthetase
MSPRRHLFTSESVSMGHPDKIADQISDAILDAMLAVDPDARVACETLVTTGMVVVAGEVTCQGYVDIAEIVRELILEIGYDSDELGFDGRDCAVMISLDQQSPDIARGVDEDTTSGKAQGAGDQGMMFGFACRETDTLMPLPIHLAHGLVARHAEARHLGLIPGLRPDAKSQVTVECEDERPVRVHTLVLSTQHGPEWNDRQEELKQAVIEHIFKPVLGKAWWRDDIIMHVNPAGKFELGGPRADCGLTGRKIIVDTYGGRGRHGGGAFSGKDPSKVDRSATYMARYIAKLVREHFDLTPHGIIEGLDLRRPIYRATACHGHFGRTPGSGGDGSFSWEKTDKADLLRAAAGQCAGATA